ncbi:MAG: restriction endonuclease subunit S [Finegoldia magna]|nr:restriction endonuclease subunit S [Finegoldia magna]
MEFKELSFEQTQIRIIDGDRGKNYPKKSDLRQRGHTLFLNNKNIINNYLDDSFGEYISEEKSNLLRKGKLERGDLVISTRGSIGNVGYYSSDIRTENIRINSGMLIIRNFDNSIDTEYLYVLMRSNFMKQRYKERISGSVQNQLPIRDFKKIKIPIPDLHSQIIIKNVILTLDSKIEINNKIISNLESQAQAIFKSWFVDFEPFQDGDFVESELGMIPKGWEVKELGEVADCKLGGTPSRKKREFWNGDIPWVNSGEVNKDRIIEPSEYITEDGLKNSATKLLKRKTTLVAITGATLGQVSLLEIDCCTNQSIIGIEPNEKIPYEYIYLFIKNNINKIISNQTGAAQQHINLNDIRTSKIIIPQSRIMTEYVKIVSLLMSKVEKNYFVNTKLAELRDALLPKLMAGEIDVSNIKIEGEEVKNE